MQRVMIVSDTHKKLGNFMEAVDKEEKIDLILHLGDVEGDEDIIRDFVDCEVIFVPGNNDYYSREPREREIVLAGKKILMTHGHLYYVSLDLYTIKEMGISRGFDIVMFGHTHKPVISVEDEITLINPGSLSYPRQLDKKPTYIIMEIDDNNEISFNLKSI